MTKNIHWCRNCNQAGVPNTTCAEEKIPRVSFDDFETESNKIYVRQKKIICETIREIGHHNEHTKEYIDAMKPSERIKEAFKAKPNELCSDSVYLSRAFDEIGKILDEVYQQNKPCEHKNIEDFRGLDACKDCGVVGWLKD